MAEIAELPRPEKPKRMREKELVGLLQEDMARALGKDNDELSSQRAKALEYYLREPYGNEVKGRSQIVTSEVFDTIEWLLPQTLKPFTTGTTSVAFEPVGPEDIQQAAQETDVVNHALHKENEGFQILYAWMKDAFLAKNGVVHYYWDESEDVTVEEYEGLTDDELILLGQDDELTPETHFQRQEFLMGQPINLHDVKYKRITKTGKPKIEVIHPERVIVPPEHDTISVQDAPYFGHESLKRRSDLINEGFDKKIVNALPAYRGSLTEENEEENYARQSDIEQTDWWTKTGGDASMDDLLVANIYKYVDYDGDGIAELRHIILVNRTHIILNEEAEEIQYVGFTPIPMTHRFTGLSLADTAMDLQLHNSALLRNVYDNIYLQNNQRTLVTEGMVNLDDLLTSRPGGVVRQNAPGSVEPFPTPPLSPSVFGLIERMDEIRENRTGVTRYNQGMDADSLNKTASGINQIMTASQARIELVARLFADSLKSLMLGLHGLLQRHQRKQMVVRIRNQFVPVDPSEWKHRTNMSVNVTLGRGDSSQQFTTGMAILQTQLGLAQQGLTVVNPQNIYNTLVRLTEAAGISAPELYFTDPSTVPPPEPQPDPQMALEQQKLQIEAQKNEIRMAEIQLEQQRLEMEKAVAAEKAKVMRFEAERRYRADTDNADTARYTAELDHDAKMEQVEASLEIAEMREDSAKQK